MAFKRLTSLACAAVIAGGVLGLATTAAASAAPLSGAGSTGASGTRPGPVAIGSRPASLALPGGLSPVWPVLFLLGSAVMAAGLRRLPDRVLVEEANICSLEVPK